MKPTIHKPLEPEDVLKAKIDSIPNYIIGIFNRFIANNWDGKKSFFYTQEIENAIKNFNKNISLIEVYKNKWLDVGIIYETVGWDVKRIHTKTECSFTFKPINNEIEDSNREAIKNIILQKGQNG